MVYRGSICTLRNRLFCKWPVREVVLFSSWLLVLLLLVPYRCWMFTHCLAEGKKKKKRRKSKKWLKPEELKWKKRKNDYKVSESSAAPIECNIIYIHRAHCARETRALSIILLKWEITFSVVLFTPSKEYHWVVLWHVKRACTHTIHARLHQREKESHTRGERERERDGERLIVIWREYTVVIDLYYLFIIFRANNTSRLNFENPA